MEIHNREGNVMVTLPYPEPTNTTGLQGLMKYANTVTDGAYGYGILLTTWIALFLFLISKDFDAADSAVSVSFLVTIMAIFLRYMNVVTQNSVVYLCFFVLLMSTAWMYFKA